MHSIKGVGQHRAPMTTARSPRETTTAIGRLDPTVCLTIRTMRRVRSSARPHSHIGALNLDLLSLLLPLPSSA